jgi:hypothetical protein
MKIKSVQLKNFKRFTDLSINGIPESCKLVLLIGANGSGKSSLFDVFNYFQTQKIKPSMRDEVAEYYQKGSVIGEFSIDTSNGKIHSLIGIQSSGDNLDSLRFFGRSSIRIVPTLGNKGNPYEIEADADRPEKFIDNDIRFVNDVYAYIKQIDDAMREPVFSGRKADTLQIFHRFIDPLNQSLSRIFENHKDAIQIVEFASSTPEVAAKLIFKKGDFKINYDLLSHGEKQVVVLLLNFIVRKKQYEDAIIYIDEMDCHLNTTLQETLLKEIVEKWIPDSSQLWTASHALGFIDYARKTDDAVILDFDSLDFDVPQILTPQSKEVLDVYDIAIPKSVLSQLFSDKKIVFCENKNDEYYNLMGLEKTLFVGVKDSRDVFLNAKNDKTKFTLRDRDFISDSEIVRIQENFPNHRILKYYDFENYLYHPENIAELSPEGFDKEKYQAAILQQKKDKIHYILPKIEAARKTYEEFKTDFMEKEIKNYEGIVDDFVSDDFERFYKFFDMKDQFNRSYLAQFNLTIKALSSTKWFKTQIEKILQ